MPYSRIGVRTGAAHQQLVRALDNLATEFKLPEGFDSEVLAEVDRAIAEHRLPPEDLTALPFLTIDPPASLDLDQAMYLERHDEGGYVVHYAIADVPSFVRPGGALDAETRRRGQTIYTPGHRVSLHPHRLSEDAASLLARDVRSAFVWQIRLDDDGRHVSARVRRATVRSIAKLGYEQAQDMHDGGTAPAAVSGTLALLGEIGKKRIALERARGGASLNAPQQEVEFADGRYTLAFRPALPIEDWNAQISLLTGMAAADLMIQGKVGILRTMPEPDPETMEAYRLQTVALGKPWAKGMPYGEYLRTLDSRDPRQLALMHAATALFRGAAYTPFDGTVPEGTVQAAVAAPYAHTTAPLRRLVDRFVLTICAALSAGTEVPAWAREALPELPAIMAASDQLANKVDKAAVDTIEAAVLCHELGREFDAVVLSGARNGARHAENNGARRTETNGNHNGNGGNGKSAAPRSTIALKEPAVAAYCEGDLPPGTVVRVRLIEADIDTRSVLFTPVHPAGADGQVAPTR